MAGLAILGQVILSVSVDAAPYCVLRKSFNPPQDPCFQFYLADTAVAPPNTMAVVAGALCVVTDLAARQGWIPDPMLPGPHPDWTAGDAAMDALSPYAGDLYQCRGTTGGSTGGGPTDDGTTVGGGVACQEVQKFTQPESRDETGRITVEAAIIHVVECPNQQQFYIYEYLNRTGFRVIRPPGWSQPIGGRDVGTMGDALGVAMDAANNAGISDGEHPPQGTGPIQVTAATYGANCGQPRGNVTGFVASACNGKPTCDYEIHWETIGDPAYGCQKDFSVEWTCGPGISLSTRAEPEAGYGSHVFLGCSGGN